MERRKYTTAELRDMRIADLVSDAEFAERQAENGPFYPHLSVTRETLLDHAAKCREQVESILTGSEH